VAEDSVPGLSRATTVGVHRRPGQRHPQPDQHRQAGVAALEQDVAVSTLMLAEMNQTGPLRAHHAGGLRTRSVTPSSPSPSS
jgi:hypothetical protein